MILFDTDVVIDLTHGGGPAFAFLASLGASSLPISSAVAMDFLVDSRYKVELQRAKALRAFQIVALDMADSRLALRLVERDRLSTGLSFADLLIAAQALNRGAILYTSDLRHFGAIPSLGARAPYPR